MATRSASPAYSQIYAITDPEDVLNETLRTNNMAPSAPVLLQVVGSNGTTTTVPTYPQNVFTSATLASPGGPARSPSKTQVTNLGTPKPAAAMAVKKSPQGQLPRQHLRVDHQVHRQRRSRASPRASTTSSTTSAPAAPRTAPRATTTTSASTATPPRPPRRPSPPPTSAPPPPGGTGGFGATPINSLNRPSEPQRPDSRPPRRTNR